MLTNESLTESISKYLETQKHPPKNHVNRISELGDVCMRRLVYKRIASDKAEDIDTSLQGVFSTGTTLESVIGRIIEEIGERHKPPFRISGKQLNTSKVDTFLKKYKIEGTLDGILEIYASELGWEEYAVCDIKTCSPYIFDSINTVEDLQRFEWMKKYIGQGMLYALACNLDKVVLVFVNKTNLFRIKLIEFDLDLGYADELIKKAEVINASVEMIQELEKNNAIHGDEYDYYLPKQINEFDVCRRCQFNAHCNPALQSTGNLEPLDNQEVAEMLKRRQELKPLHSEYNEVDKHLKKLLIPKQDVICGDFSVYWTEVKRKEYTVSATTQHRMKIVENVS